MILITGGSGFVGSHLIPRLVKQGFKVKCLVLDEKEAQKAKALGAETAMGNIADAKSVTEAAKGADAIIHMVAILREHGTATFEAVNVGGTKNALAAAKEAGVKRFVHMGILGASSNPKYKYLHSKWKAILEVEKSGLDYTIFKPSVMFGEGAGFISALLRSIKMFPLIAPVAGSGKTMLQPIWVEDIVSCIIEALQGKCVRGACEIGGPEHLKYEDVMQAVMDAASIRKPKVHIPIALMRPAVILMEKLSSNPPITKDELDALELDNITEIDALQKHFGFMPLGIKEGLNYLGKGD